MLSVHVDHVIAVVQPVQRSWPAKLCGDIAGVVRATEIIFGRMDDEGWRGDRRQMLLEMVAEPVHLDEAPPGKVAENTFVFHARNDASQTIVLDAEGRRFAEIETIDEGYQPDPSDVR